MNPADWLSDGSAERRFARALKAWLEEFAPGILTNPDSWETLSEGMATSRAEVIARRMISGVAQVNARSWRAAARQSLHGKRIYEALRTEMGGALGMRVDELIAANAKLIQAMPDRIAARAAAFIAREQRRGTRAATIEETLRARLPELARSQIKMLARTQVGRAETALTEARAERLNVAWYQWATSEDRRVRPSHRKVDKLLIRWSDPCSPEKLAGLPATLGYYAPGQTYNCRCLALPLIDLNEVSWPHRVYMHGSIERVGRAEFERWNRRTQAA